MSEALQKSPLATYIEYCKKSELAYQVCTDDESAVFYPRVVAPRTASPNLEWRVSKGLGTVYATTTVHQREGEPYNVSLIELDEGFRMMSRVEEMSSDEVKVGMRVKVRMHPGNEKQPPYPVFMPAGDSK